VSPLIKSNLSELLSIVRAGVVESPEELTVGVIATLVLQYAFPAA